MSIVLNGGAALVILGSLVMVARSYVVGERVEACRARYDQGVQWSFEREGGGELMSAYDLQARLAGTDWGLHERAEIVSVANSPTAGALQIDLARVLPDNGETASKRTGAGFRWAPADMDRPRAACLSYSVFVPEGFDFGPGGRLPGLEGGTGEASEKPASRFATRFAWSDKGVLLVHGDVPGAPAGRGIANSRRPETLSRGRWVRLEQEVVLNTPDQKNGILRLWMDGALVHERRDVAYRSTPEARVSGVLAEVAYARQPAKPPANAKVWLTPFELRWK